MLNSRRATRAVWCGIDSKAPPVIRSCGRDMPPSVRRYEADPEPYAAEQRNELMNIFSRPSGAGVCHHGKCCYCETTLDANSEVRHWRPRRCILVAYSWDNLLLPVLLQ